MARGEETDAGNPNDELPSRLKLGCAEMGGGLVAEGADADADNGAAELLNSAQRGHLRLVSARVAENGADTRDWRVRGSQLAQFGKAEQRARHSLMCPFCPQWPQRR